MKQHAGFTLIEILTFIVISSILLTTILIGSNFLLLKNNNTQQQWQALQLAQQCMEKLITQKRNLSLTTSCPVTLASNYCSTLSGYTVTASIACSTWNTDTTYRTATVAVNGTANANLSILLGKF